jgi:hypothetical protein
MSLVGPDGKTPVSSESVEYAAGGVQINSTDTPESLLIKALSGAQQAVAQQAGVVALQRTQSQVVAQAEAQSAALQVTNPFHLEPCALSVFMILAREIGHRNKIIAVLAERLDKLDGQSSEELLKKPWPEPVMPTQENETKENGESKESDDAFSKAVENLTQSDKSESN